MKWINRYLNTPWTCLECKHQFSKPHVTKIADDHSAVQTVCDHCSHETTVKPSGFGDVSSAISQSMEERREQREERQYRQEVWTGIQGQIPALNTIELVALKGEINKALTSRKKATVSQ